MKTSLNKIIVAVLLLIISLVALTPKLTLADQQASQTGIVVINVSGNAEAINNGLSGSVTLNLVGAGSKDANQDLQMSNVTGTLSIGSKNLTVSDGHGSTNAHGDIAIFASTSLAGNMLFLHGTVQGNNVTFISPESRLSIVSLLSLTGSINVNGVTGTTSQSQSTTENTTGSLNSTSSMLAPNASSSTLMGNGTLQNATTVLVPQTSNFSLGNVTGVSTAVANTTSTSISNSTTSSSNSTVSEVVAAITSDSTTTKTTNQTTTTATINSALPPQTTTVTVTQFNNQTIIEAHTVASVTITYTTTTTLANTTITQPNTTTTTSNSTSTTSTP